MQNMGINQLANMYMGNPQPLAQKVQQAQQQAKPGQIPPDLKEALALQQIQDMRQAAQNQQAMQAGGPQPTVVDQLKQMIARQAQPTQGMPQGTPQGMPQGAPQQMAPQPAPQGLPAIPQGAAAAPQPPSEEQPGLPQLPNELGQHYDGGGIVAFAGGGKAKQQAFENAISDTLEQQDFEGTPDQPYTDETIYPGARPPNSSKNKTIFYPNGMVEAAPRAKAESIAMKTQALLEKEPPPNPVINEGGIADYFTAKKKPVEGAPSEVETYLRKRFAVDEEAKGAAAEAKARAAYGAPNTEGYDRAVEELKRRQAQFAAPATGMPALMEYLQQIAAAPKGVGSLTAGAMGAQKVNELKQQREANQFDLAKQILEQEQKKADVTRGYAKEMYGINSAAIKEAGDQAYNAAIALHKSEDEAKKLAKEAELRTAEMLSREKTSAANNAATLAAANAPGQAQQMTNRIEALKKIGTPAALLEAKNLEETYTRLVGSGASGASAAKTLTRQLEVQIKDLEKSSNKLTNPTATPEEIARDKQKLAAVRQRMAVISGISDEEEGGKSAPTVIKFDASGNPIKG